MIQSKSFFGVKASYYCHNFNLDPNNIKLNI